MNAGAQKYRAEPHHQPLALFDLVNSLENAERMGRKESCSSMIASYRLPFASFPRLMVFLIGWAGIARYMPYMATIATMPSSITGSLSLAWASACCMAGRASGSDQAPSNAESAA